MKKILSLLLALAMLLAVMPIGAVSAAGMPTVVVGSVEGMPGEMVEVTVKLENNPGIISMKLCFDYDSDVLELVSRTPGSSYATMAFNNDINRMPYIANWVDSIHPDNTATDFVTLTFKIKEDAPEGNAYIRAAYNQADVFNHAWEDVYFAVENGGVEVVHCRHEKTTETAENHTELTCVINEGYDKVVTCDECGKELSRTTIITKYAIGHKFVDNYCTVCGAAEFTEPTIKVHSIEGVRGEQVDVKISLVNNPGITSMKLGIKYDANVLELIKKTPGKSYATMANGPLTANPFVVNWVDSINPNVTDSDFVTITFNIKDGAVLGETPITIVYDQADVFDENFGDVAFDIANGKISVIECRHETKIVGELDPTCTEKGYTGDEVCTLCGRTMNYGTEIDALGHTEAEAVVEKHQESTCTETGSYDSVVYCSVCNEELSRVTKTIAALGHDEIGHDAVAPTCTAIGNKAYVTCSRCDYTTYEEIAALGHTEGETVVENAIAPDCETWGSYDNVCYCTVCNEELSRVTIKTAKGHKLDVNGKCSVCKETVEEPTFFVTSDKALLGKEVKVNVVVKNNPGIVSMKLGIDYDSDVFELVTAEGGAFTTVAFGPTTNHPFYVNWVDSINPNNTTDGIVATLTFKVKDEAAVGTSVITIDYDPDDVYDANFENVGFEKNYGFMEVRDYTPGDANDDGVINNKDLGLLMQYIIEEDVFVMLYACDVNADGKINNRDYALLMQYVNGWNVELLK